MYLATLRPFVQLVVPSAADPVVDLALITAARDFCRDTGVWVTSLTPINIVANTAVYTLTPPTGMSIVDVESVLVEGNKCRPSTPAQRDADDPGWLTKTESRPRYFLRASNTSIRLVRTPSIAIVGGLAVEVVGQPSLTATTLSDDFAEEYGVGIADGAIARLLMAPDYSWHNPALASVYVAAFQGKIDDAASRAADRRTKHLARTVRYGGY